MILDRLFQQMVATNGEEFIIFDSGRRYIEMLIRS